MLKDYNAAITSERIKKRAKEIGVTISNLNAICDISENTIKRAGKSTEGMKARNLYMIAEVLDCSVDYLLGRSDTPTNDNSKNTDHMASIIFGHDDGITISMVEDVLRYAKMVELYETVNRAKQSGGVTAIAIEPYDSIHDPRIERIRNELRKIQMDVEVVSDVDIEEIKSQKKPVETK